MDQPATRTIQGYQLEELIGEGAYGAVYRARQEAVDRQVAVKIILPEFANRPEFIRRFETEAQLVAQLEHLHIVPLYDYWRDPPGRLPGHAPDEGRQLGRVNGARCIPGPLNKSAQLVEQVASALDACPPARHRPPRYQTRQHPARRARQCLPF